jgi:hypothetical protein
VEQTLTTYCNALVKGDYQTAYDQISSGNKKIISEKDWAAMVSTHLANASGLVECTASDTHDDGSSGEGTLILLYNDKLAQYLQEHLTNENGEWKVVSGQCTAGCG